MKVEGGLAGDLREIPERVRALEAAGYERAMAAEMAHDPFLPLLLAAEHSERIELMTSVAVAFSRSPMTLATLGHDLNAYSRGRFVLGLGAQVRAHITRRFSMPWSHPARRMRELVLALRAIWTCWYEDKPLDFRGEFYQHTLMTSPFVPTNVEHGPPRVYLGAIGPRMTEVAGEVADGMISHAFTTERYLREVTLPRVERGLEKASRRRADFCLTGPVFVVSGADSASTEASRRIARRGLAFYASTPAYRSVLELHGWGELQAELAALSKQGRPAEMEARIPDEVLDAFAVTGGPDEVAREIVRRYGGLLDRVSCIVQGATPEHQARVVEALRRRRPERGEKGRK